MLAAASIHSIPKPVLWDAQPDLYELDDYIHILGNGNKGTATYRRHF